LRFANKGLKGGNRRLHTSSAPDATINCKRGAISQKARLCPKNGVMAKRKGESETNFTSSTSPLPLGVVTASVGSNTVGEPYWLTQIRAITAESFLPKLLRINELSKTRRAHEYNFIHQEIKLPVASARHRSSKFHKCEMSRGVTIDFYEARKRMVR